MGTLGFDKYAEPLKMYLTKYRDSVRGDKPEKKSGGRKDHLINSGNLKPFSDKAINFQGINLGGVLGLSDHDGSLSLPSFAPGKSDVRTLLTFFNAQRYQSLKMQFQLPSMRAGMASSNISLNGGSSNIGSLMNDLQLSLINGMRGASGSSSSAGTMLFPDIMLSSLSGAIFWKILFQFDFCHVPA